MLTDGQTPFLGTPLAALQDKLLAAGRKPAATSSKTTRRFSPRRWRSDGTRINQRRNKCHNPDFLGFSKNHVFVRGSWGGEVLLICVFTKWKVLEVPQKSCENSLAQNKEALRLPFHLTVLSTWQPFNVDVHGFKACSLGNEVYLWHLKCYLDVLKICMNG